jgi:hypothetical protein
VSDALSAVSLPSLPAIGSESLLLATALLVLLTISVAGRAMLAWQALERRRATLDETAARLGDEPIGVERAVALRRELAAANIRLEGALWALPAIDQHVATVSGRLAAIRARVDDWRGENGEGVRQSIGAAAGALEVLSAARRLRRVIQR